MAGRYDFRRGGKFAPSNKLLTLNDLEENYLSKARLGGWPIFVYGNSYGILSAPYFTAGRHWTQLLAKSMGGGTVTSYAIGAKRILDVLSALLNEASFPGLGTPAPVAGSKWPGTSQRTGLVVLESLINDFGHYPSMQGVSIPAALPAGNTRYKDSLAVQYRAALALMSSESRVEQSARTATSGTWTHDSNQGYPSSSTVSFTSAAGAYLEYTVTPPQYGPLAGKVFLLGFALDPSVGVMAQQTISVDGVVQTTRTPSGWEQYTGPGGVAVQVAMDVAAVTLPVDGASHVIRLAHSGAGGQFMYSDGLLIPSVSPNPILIPGAEHKLVGAPTWNTAQTSVYTQNEKTLTPVIKAVAAEFPNVVWAESTMTTAGIYSVDGIHQNELGNAQRAVDAEFALRPVKPRLDNLALAKDLSVYAIL